MTLTHTDPARKVPQYCATPCPLCQAAAKMQLTNDRTFVEDSQAIRAMRNGQQVDVAQQPDAVQAFFRCVGFPLVAEVTAPIDPARDP